MRRTCERPACGQPVAVVYGQESGVPDGVQQFWIDSWSPDLADATPPVGTRGVLCAGHGEQLVPPRGWTLVDRRDDVPRLFKPRLVLDESTSSQAKSSRNPGTRRLTGPTPRRMSDVPRPQLFSDIDRDTSDAPDTTTTPRHRAEVTAREASETEVEIDGILNASGSLLRDAFRRANSIKRDATKELMRPTSSPNVTSRDSDGQ